MKGTDLVEGETKVKKSKWASFKYPVCKSMNLE